MTIIARSRLQRASTRALACLAAITCLALLWWFWPVDVPRFADVKAQWTPSDALLLDREGVVLDHRRMNFNARRAAWTPLATVSPALTAAIVDGEDRRFWSHHGVDWQALLGAVRDNSEQRRRGASTITMQVATLLQPTVRAGNGAGAWWRKLAQMRFARAMESRWTKAEILETYLNLLGFRGELQGIGAAAEQLAGKSPAGLTLTESLVLASLLPAPRASPTRVVARACARSSARKLATDCAAISATAAVFFASGAQSMSRDDDHLAPQLARLMLTKPGEQLRTTLDAHLQHLARDVLRTHLQGLIARNVRDGAVLIVENATGKVLAYVGSAGPASTAHEVDGVRAHRQAGSTLKPFLYQLAIERGYLTAASLLNDSPITLDTASGIYLPQDYDRDFKGLVSARTALGSSLNIPAVRTLMLTGVEPFRDRLYALGYTTITQPGDFYGYSLALGSAEVSLWEQVQAYRALARGGRWSELQLRSDAAVNAAQPQRDHSAFDANAAFIVADMLSDRAARTLTFGLDSHLDTPFWSAVKTGTSKDMRDNWCVGFSALFTVGVWVGNFEGDAMHDVSGITGAAPVWQEIMQALHAHLPSMAPDVPAGITATAIAFVPAIEAPRRELFIGNAAMPKVVRAPGIARIASPANGMIIALDPDIPPLHQRVPIATRGIVAGMVLRLNGALLGPAQRSILWRPTRGAHLLALQDAMGHTLDQSRFVVR